MQTNFEYPERSDNAHDLSSRVVRGGAIIFGFKIVARALDFAGTIILARLLTPFDFGIVGMAGVVLAGIEICSETGFTRALVHRQGNLEPYLDTAWTVAVFRGLVLAGVLWVAAPFAADFFREEQMTGLLRLLSIHFAINGLVNIGTVFFQKEMRFGYQMAMDVGGSIVGLTAKLLLAYILRDYWAIVLGALIGGFVRVLLSFALHSYRPRFRFNITQAKELTAYGKWIFASSVLWFLVLQGDDLFVGKFMGIAAAGFYQMAFKLSNLPATEISNLVARVTFPAYSLIQHQHARMSEAFLKTIKFVSVFTFPVTGGIIIWAPEGTRLLLGNRWLAIIGVVQVLAISGLFRALTVTTGSVFLSLGRPSLDTKWQSVRLSVMVVLIYPLTMHFGLSGAAYCVTLSMIVTFSGCCFDVLRLLPIGLTRLLAALCFPLFNTMLTVAVVYTVKVLWPIVEVVDLLVSVAIAAVVYTFLSFVFDRLFNFGLFAYAKDIVGDSIKRPVFQKRNHNN